MSGRCFLNLICTEMSTALVTLLWSAMGGSPSCIHTQHTTYNWYFLRGWVELWFGQIYTPKMSDNCAQNNNNKNDVQRFFNFRNEICYVSLTPWNVLNTSVTFSLTVCIYHTVFLGFFSALESLTHFFLAIWHLFKASTLINIISKSAIWLTFPLASLWNNLAYFWFTLFWTVAVLLHLSPPWHCNCE